jgi:hypothetical protein
MGKETFATVRSTVRKFTFYKVLFVWLGPCNSIFKELFLYPKTIDKVQSFDLPPSKHTLEEWQRLSSTIRDDKDIITDERICISKDTLLGGDMPLGHFMQKSSLLS